MELMNMEWKRATWRGNRLRVFKFYFNACDCACELQPRAVETDVNVCSSSTLHRFKLLTRIYNGS